MSFANRELGVPTIVIPASAIANLNTLATADLTQPFTVNARWTFNAGLDINSDLNIGKNLTNYLQITGNASSSPVTLTAVGADPNINISIVPKGTGSITVPTDLIVGTGYGNAIKIQGSAGGTPSITTTGLADLDIVINPNGSGRVFLQGDTIIASTYLQISSTVLPNYLYLSGSSTGIPVNIAALGSDPNISINLTPQGTGVTNILSNLNIGTNLANYLQITGAASASPVTLQAQGSDGFISINLVPKGTGVTNILSSLSIGTNLANYLQLSGAASASPVTLQAIGSDTNISINVIPKGAGTAQYKGAEIARTGYTAAITTITVGASPFLYTNPNTYPVYVFIISGSVSNVEFSRDETTFYSLATTTGQKVLLAPGDSVRVSFTIAPNMYAVPM